MTSGGAPSPRGPVPTPRLLLEPADPRRAPDLFPIWTDPLVTRFTYIRGLRTVEDCEARLARHAEAAASAGTLGPFTVLKDGAVIGYAGASRLEGPTLAYELFYHLARAEWGRGYGKEVAGTLLALAFAGNRAQAAAASAVTANTASWTLLESLGMRRIRTAPGAFENSEGLWDLHEYGLSRQEWADRRPDRPGLCYPRIP